MVDCCYGATGRRWSCPAVQFDTAQTFLRHGSRPSPFPLGGPKGWPARVGSAPTPGITIGVLGPVPLVASARFVADGSVWHPISMTCGTGPQDVEESFVVIRPGDSS
jgi:hypothetical protein